MQGVIKDQRVQQLIREDSAPLIAQIRREKAEAKGALASFLAEIGIDSLHNYIQQRCSVSV